MITAEHEYNQRLYQALGIAMSEWALVDNALVRCYAQCKGRDIEAEWHAFWQKYGRSAFGTRKKEASKVIALHVIGDEALGTRWAQIEPKLMPLADRRNAMAHGSVGWWDGQPSIAPYYFARLDASDVLPQGLLRVDDINAARNDFVDLKVELIAFYEALGGTTGWRPVSP